MEQLRSNLTGVIIKSGIQFVVFAIAGLVLYLLSIPELSAQDPDSTSFSVKAKQAFDKSVLFKTNNDIPNALISMQKAKDNYYKAKNWVEFLNASVELNKILEEYDDSNGRLQNFRSAIPTAIENLPSHRHYAHLLRKKAELHIEMNQLDSAQINLKESIRISRNISEWKELAWSHLIMSVVNYYQSELDSMSDNINKAAYLIDYKIKDQYEFIGSLHQLQSILYYETGDTRNASISVLKSLERLYAIPNHSNNDSLTLANAHNTYGAINEELGDYELAIKHYKIALSLHQEMKHTPLSTQINIGNNLSLAYKKKTEWKQAEFYLKKSQSLLSKKPNDNNFKEWIQTHQLLAANYLDLEEYAEGLKLLEKLIPISEYYDYYQEWVYGSYGRALNNTGDHIKAIRYLDKSIRKLNSTYGDKHGKVALMLRVKGQAFLNLGKPDNALEVFQNALYALTTKDHPKLNLFDNPNLDSVLGHTELLNILFYKGLALKAMDPESPTTFQALEDTYNMSVNLIEFLRSKYQTDEAKLLLSTKSKYIFEAKIGLLYNKYKTTQDEKIAEEIFTYMEKSKALLLQENIQSSSKIKYYSSYLQDTTTLFEKLISQRKIIQTELLFFETNLKKAQQENLNSNHPKILNAEKAIAELYKDLNSVETKIKNQFPSYSRMQLDTIESDFNSIRNLVLDPKTVIIEFFVGEESTYAIVITPNDAQLIKLGNTEDLRKRTLEFQHQLSSYVKMSVDAKNTITAYNHAATTTFESILKPAIELIPPDIESLIIIPDEFLNELSFEALNTHTIDFETTDFAKLPFLIDEFNFQYGYSVNTLIHNQEQYTQLEANIKCLALAPSYDSNDSSIGSRLDLQRNETADLPGTKNEINGIAQYFNGVFESGKNANEHLFKQKANDFGLIHLASHGVADFENPNFGYLLFSNYSNDTLQDNLLHQYEIVNMNLSCQMAVLSACETGLGKYEKGEGVFSLARGFTVAGVPSIVMSLWKINDKSTSEIIPEFYKHLSRGNPKDVALQQAKVDYLNNAELKYRHPFYWAGLVLIGEDQALKTPDSIGIIPILFITLLLILGILFLYRKKLIQLLK